MDTTATDKLPIIKATVFLESGFCRSHSQKGQLLDYLSAGILLHAMTTMEILSIFGLIPFLLDSDACLSAYRWRYFTFATLWLLPVFTQLDARSRFQEYKKIRDQLILFGPDRRIFNAVSHSRCQRNAALAASAQLGYETVCRDSFTATGYRWYHLLPSFVKYRPWFLFSPAFWHTTFFAPTYHPRQWLRQSIPCSVVERRRSHNGNRQLNGKILWQGAASDTA
jgi:hypothetical protein